MIDSLVCCDRRPGALRSGSGSGSGDWLCSRLKEFQGLTAGDFRGKLVWQPGSLSAVSRWHDRRLSRQKVNLQLGHCPVIIIFTRKHEMFLGTKPNCVQTMEMWNNYRSDDHKRPWCFMRARVRLNHRTWEIRATVSRSRNPCSVAFSLNNVNVSMRTTDRKRGKAPEREGH